MSATDVRARGNARDSVQAEAGPGRANRLTSEDRLGLLRYMMMMRLSEERALKLYKQESLLSGACSTSTTATPS